MNGDEHIGLRLVSQMSPLIQGNVVVVLACIDDLAPETTLQQSAQPLHNFSTTSFSSRPRRPTVPRSHPPCPASSTMRNFETCARNCVFSPFATTPAANAPLFFSARPTGGNKSILLL